MRSSTAHVLRNYHAPYEVGSRKDELFTDDLISAVLFHNLKEDSTCISISIRLEDV